MPNIDISVSDHYPTFLTPPKLALGVSYPVQWRAQGIGGKMLFPKSRGEFMHARGRVLADALKHIDQVVVGIDAVQFARDH